MIYIPQSAEQDSDTKTPTWEILTTPRSAIIERVDRLKSCDLLIAGGGIAGAALARLAAFNGLRTVLLEKNDYASATSSRSSKMVHGGLRYLQTLDLKLVMEGVKAREQLFHSAAHLVHPQQFLIPVPKSRPFSRPKFAAGLTLYDLLARPPKERRHRWLPAEKLAGTVLEPAARRLAGAFSFFDGVMDDSRLVLENILAARQEGALCLNYAELVSFEVRRDRTVEVSWRDTRTGSSHTITTGIIVNCAGPWAPTLGRISAAPEFGPVRYSRGAHLLFSKRWDGPAVLLERPERGRLYFIWPHPAGTMVGTTENDTPSPSFDPIPTTSEVREILEALQRDFPEAGLTRESLHYGFAGIRTLPLRSATGPLRSATGPLRSATGLSRAAANRGSSAVSRRHRWVHTSGMLTLIGGKFTSAEWTAREGLEKVYELSEIITPLVPIAGRKLPGAGGLEGASADFEAKCRTQGVPDGLARAAIARFGSGVRHFSKFPGALESVGGAVLRGEIELCLRVEQCEGLEDLMRRRLGIEYHRGAGLDGIEAIAEVVRSIRPEFDASAEVARYRDRIARIQTVLFEHGQPT